MNDIVRNKVKSLKDIVNDNAKALCSRIDIVCEDAYHRGFRDGVDKGFTWHTGDEVPPECQRVLVTIVEYDEKDYVSDKYVTIGYLHKGSWIAAGKVLDFTEDLDIIGWAELPTPAKGE